MLYEELLAKPDTLLRSPWSTIEPVGYGLTHVLPVADSWIADTG